MAATKSAYQRWDIHQRLQHIGVFSSFTLCAITGLSIKFNHAPWARSIVDFFGGFETMFKWHLFGGLILTLACIYHLVWMAVKAWKGELGWAVMPTLKDFTDLADHLKYQLGLSEQPARFDRYSYKEKFDYWAVFWGMFIIGGSGFVMWFPEWGASFLPRWLIDCWRVGHSDEAVLAVLVIFTWHFYNVHFNPDFFPGNTLWFSGLMDEEVMEHEHPLELMRIRQQQAQNGIPLLPKQEVNHHGSV
ncbi:MULTISPECIES: formate dehydrogenase subunit gamma [unclassified Carboxydocella]|uniref:formate dehydrogenase subunit gamma n=1 Tax=unclassified Carboxydocella TaxID=2685367 RepID=UPI0009AD96AB|nr:MULTISPECIES: cytochrome b/b6 domain-containing protein [unclassified Carboxydocella]GAW28533.1 cytochrome B [Carboxydocella sp. ULO1]GAW32400.1 cytochrome B [Carboxydocella sp. JDF658]